MRVGAQGLHGKRAGAPMICGSGMIARALARTLGDDSNVLVYAAGVSNSSCRDPREFARDSGALVEQLKANPAERRFVYVSTCSIDDPSLEDAPYVVHKRAMEELVMASAPRSLVVRLPQVAGTTPNPHTLLNFLYARISRSERFQLWANATRNVIDVDDVGRIVCVLRDEQTSGIVNIAAPRSVSMGEIVSVMEAVTGKVAIFDRIERGEHFAIDIAPIAHILRLLADRFEGDYLRQTLCKYYGSARGRGDVRGLPLGEVP